jgi:hypothetical protein
MVSSLFISFRITSLRREANAGIAAARGPFEAETERQLRSNMSPGLGTTEEKDGDWRREIAEDLEARKSRSGVVGGEQWSSQDPLTRS